MPNSQISIIAVDWRILIDDIPRTSILSAYRLKAGAKQWVSRNNSYCIWAVLFERYYGDEVIIWLLQQVVGKISLFDSLAEAIAWISTSPEVLWLYSNDTELLEFGECVKPFSGWDERPETWITKRP